MPDPKVEYRLPAATAIRQGSLLLFTNPGYQRPSPNELRAALDAGGLTGATAAAVLGVSGRTLRKWRSGDRDIPYSAWRLLIITLGLAIDGRETKARYFR
jgi:DNA-binding transcriptional regulator YiaG